MGWVRCVGGGHRRAVVFVDPYRACRTHAVRNHLRHAMARVGVHTKLEAVVAAPQAGLIRLGEGGC